MSQREVSALNRWRAFATGLVITVSGKPKTWQEYTEGGGYSDEEKIVQPTAFPAFADQCLGWTLQLNLAPEESGAEGKPDFTPADSVTHPFVFETKSTNEGVDLHDHAVQITRYLTDGKPRIKSVLLTNLVGARVFVLDDKGELHLKYQVNLRGLLIGPVETVAKMPEARRLADLFDDFKRQELNSKEKIARVRNAPKWNPVVEVTSSNWILGRIDQIVAVLTSNVLGQIKSGALLDTSKTSAEERKSILAELRLLATRLGQTDADKLALPEFLAANESSPVGMALQQYGADVAYYAATRLMLVRVWEDLGLLKPMLHDGGFDDQMNRFSGALKDVIDYSFTRAKKRYRSLFDQRNGYTWYQPDTSTYTDVIYELANTYLGAIQSDVLGQVYERMLARIDRKLLGVYYTPRDIISLIWDLIDFPKVAQEAETNDRGLRVLDIATGSGGFLVEAARRLRYHVQDAIKSGANITLQEWINDTADGLNGVELNRFSAYLAELNLLVQFGQLIASDPKLRLPPMGVLSGDTLSLHDPVTIIDDWEEALLPNDLVTDDEDRRDRARKIKFAPQADFLMDVACGNPPYVGEKTAAPLMVRTRHDYPYWESFVGQHMDYLYWFLILGVSKLRAGGRFGFITTEYWLRAEGAKPLRGYLARRCHIDHIVLFRDFRLFPDAPGQHSMIVTGTRVADDDASLTLTKFPDLGSHKPKVSIYIGGPVGPRARAGILAAIREGKTNVIVRSFNARRSPNTCGDGSWADVILTQAQLTHREKLTTGDQIALTVTKGNETTANNITAKNQDLLSQKDLMAVGGPGTRAGVQLLTPQEVAELGKLNDAEKGVLRRVVNTRDIYPYAVVLPDDPNQIIYLAKPAGIDKDLSDEQVITGTPFPDGLPRIEQHLTQFRSLLEAKNRSHGERRPWWTLHRPRVDAEQVKQGGNDWAEYCVVSRWGVGGRLIVGRAPAGTSPASGLHVLRTEQGVVSAAYLAALYNSSLYQEIAESLPPGMLRKAELERIGVPLRTDYKKALVDAADALAELVTELVRHHTPRFPLLAESLRGNVALPDPTIYAWQPEKGPKIQWGLIQDVQWVDNLATHRAGGTPLGDVHVVEDLFGDQLQITVKGSAQRAATITLKAGSGEEAARPLALALAANVCAVAARGGQVRHLASISVPILSEDLVDKYAADRAALVACVTSYRNQRLLIDKTLAAML
jgi:hypothetical protein